MSDPPADPAGQLAAEMVARHNGDALAALAELARMYLVARHGWCPGFSRAAAMANS